MGTELLTLSGTLNLIVSRTYTNLPPLPRWKYTITHGCSTKKSYIFEEENLNGERVICIIMSSVLYLQATSEAAAEKQIQQLLFPRARRKKAGSHADELGGHHPL